MLQGRSQTRELKGQGNIHGVTAAGKRRCDEQLAKKNHIEFISATKKNPRKPREEVVVDTILWSTTPKSLKAIILHLLLYFVSV